MKTYIHKERFFLDEDPEFVSFFSGAVITATSIHGPDPYISLSMGDGNENICSWTWGLDEDGVATLKRYADALQRLAAAAEGALEEHG